MLHKPPEVATFWSCPKCRSWTGKGQFQKTQHVIETHSVLRLWPFSTARLPILDRSHVFRCRADENERSPATLVAGFTGGSLQIVWASWITFSSGFGNFDTAFRILSKHAIFSCNITSKILSCMPGLHACINLFSVWCFKKLELCLIVVTISSFNQEGLHLGVGAEAFLIDSTDDKINSLIIDPSKVIFGSLGLAWCASTNLQSGWSASLSWKNWFTKQAFALAGNISIEIDRFITQEFRVTIIQFILVIKKVKVSSNK